VVTTPELDFHWGVASPWSLDPKAISREECARSTTLGFIKLMSRTPCRQGCDLARAARSVTEILDRCRETRNLGGDINIVQLGIDTMLPCLQLSEQGCVPLQSHLDLLQQCCDVEDLLLCLHLLRLDMGVVVGALEVTGDVCQGGCGGGGGKVELEYNLTPSVRLW